MRKNFILPLAVALLFGCAKEPVFEPLPDADLIPINLDGSISQVATKATAQGFVDGDAVGLYAVNYSEGNTIAGTLEASGNQADNVKYVFDETAYKWTPVKGVYYKDVNTHVDLYVYYPYQAGISDVEASGFEVQKDQSAAASQTALSGYEASDWLWGKATDITPSESRVSIPLSHKLSAVQVTLVEGTGFGEDEFASLAKSVIMTNTTRKATLNFRTGEATPLGSPQLDGIVMCPQEGGAFRAIVIPQSVAAGTQLFAITLNGISYSFTQDAIVTYQAGKQMNVDITLNKKTPSGDYELVLGSTTIVDWTEDRNTHGGEARQYFVVNVVTPGTLGETITAAGKNPAKIRNLKVTGQVNADDFYFMRDNMAILEAVNMKEAKIVNTEISGEYHEGIIPGGAFSERKSLVSFVFPEVVTEIGASAFSHTTLSGPLILPNDVKSIGQSAFAETNISSIQFSPHLEVVGFSAFAKCKAAMGDLLFPDSVKSIDNYAFWECGGFNGKLVLPAGLEQLGADSFYSAGAFIGDLVIPEKVDKIPIRAFYYTTFTGSLILNNVQRFESTAFAGSHFNGPLVIPEGVVDIPEYAFRENDFSEVTFPSTLRVIGKGAFSSNPRISMPIVFPDGFRTLQESAFSNCDLLPSISLPSSAQTIGPYAFYNCCNVSSIVCNANEPPSVGSSAFDGIAKDNFTIEVPEQSVIRYQTESGWSDFKRIAAHYDFSLSRQYMRALNGAQSRTYVLRAPANFSWSVDASTLPEWVIVSPMSGTGKADVTISVSEMPRTNDTFEVNEGTFNSPYYKNYKGRSGEVVFKLDDKDYTFTFDVEQYDYDYPDGYVQTLQTATHGPGIDFVYTGDGYDARDIAKGTFATNAADGYNHIFDLEPYKTYKDYFNVYAVAAQSDDSGIGTVNTVKDSKFSTVFTQNRIRCGNPDAVFAWAKKADASMDLSKSLVILLMNTSTYEGICYMYGDGSALACCPVSTEAYPYDFRGIVQHEAGGHGFGKLADEYIYHNAYIQNCDCIDRCDHPQGDDDTYSSFGLYKSKGWYKNLSMTGDAKRVPWAHLIYHPQYSNYVDMFEGGYMHSRGMYRSEATSCMNNNIPYYSAISRQAIVERIKEIAGESFDLEDFYAHDSRAVGTKAGNYAPIDPTFGVDPLWNRGSEHGSVVYMGEHPNVK